MSRNHQIFVLFGKPSTVESSCPPADREKRLLHRRGSLPELGCAIGAQLLGNLRGEVGKGREMAGEIFDGDEPHEPNGCFAQAWSVAEALRSWLYLQSAAKLGGST